VDKRPVRLIHLCQLLGLLIFIMVVVWPVLDLWSPQFSGWLLERFGINIPIALRVVVATCGGAVAAYISASQQRFRKLAAGCGVLAAWGTFGTAWWCLNRMPELRGEMILSKWLFGVALLGSAPAYGLYRLLKRRNRQLISAVFPNEWHEPGGSS
jgi:hypothetical protein